MTKNVRIENADTSPFKVRVHVEDKDMEGNWVRQPSPQSLDSPCSMTSGTYITSHRRLVIEEFVDTPPQVMQKTADAS